jgi:hypothetical protein
MVKPISLRLRRAEVVNARAHEVLRRFEEADRLQRRVKLFATKSLISLREMNSIAAPKMRSMLPGERDRWQAEFKQIESVLSKIRKRGVG